MKKIYFLFTLTISTLIFGSSRPGSEPYVSGDTFRKHSNFIYDETTTSFDPADVKKGDTVFVATEEIAIVENKGALNNLYTHIHKCNPKDIIITLDGDDWLAHEHVLETLNNIYQDPSVWMTYGTHIDYPTYTHGSSHQLPQDIITNNKFRDYPFWATTHLRTFYAGLFQKIKLSDLLYNNIFYPMAWDCAFMFPMLEMSGMHSKFIPETLYIYNIATPLNDNKINKELQCTLSEEIRKKEKYNPLERLFNE